MYLGSSHDFTIPIGRQTARGDQPVRAGAGLGATDPPSADCPQPTSTEERDDIRNRLKEFTGNWMGQKPKGIHWHENHPDVKRAIEDIIIRMIGITQRPKKLRCSAEMRSRANKWIGSLDTLLRKVKTGGGRSYGGATSVPSTFKWGFYRGPTYTIRSTNDPGIRTAMGFAPPSSTSPAGPVVASHAPGSVVVGGEAFASSGAARASQAAAAAAAVSTGVPAAPSVSTELPTTIAGIPTNYLLFGGLALAAVMLFKK